MVIAESVNNDFKLLKKLTHTPLGTGWGSTDRVNKREWPISRGWSELVSHLGSDPRDVLRHIVECNEEVVFFEMR